MLGFRWDICLTDCDSLVITHDIRNHFLDNNGGDGGDFELITQHRDKNPKLCEKPKAIDYKTNRNCIKMIYMTHYYESLQAQVLKDWPLIFEQKKPKKEYQSSSELGNRSGLL